MIAAQFIEPEDSFLNILLSLTPILLYPHLSIQSFFKTRTGITFMDSLLELRLGHASRLLIDTTQSMAEVPYNCGFNNISNFNRLFKKKKGCTPKAFRESYSYDTRIFI